MRQPEALRLDFMERARDNSVPVAGLVGFEAEEIADGRAIEG
jgi:hypothetical protein